MFLFNQTHRALDSVALRVHDLVCPGPSLPHLWNEARTALQLWLLSDLAHLAALCVCSVRLFCSLRGVLAYFFVIRWDRLDLSLAGLLWTSPYDLLYICPYDLLNQRPSTTLGAAVSPPRNINSWVGEPPFPFPVVCVHSLSDGSCESWRSDTSWCVWYCLPECWQFFT